MSKLKLLPWKFTNLLKQNSEYFLCKCTQIIVGLQPATYLHFHILQLHQSALHHLHADAHAGREQDPNKAETCSSEQCSTAPPVVKNTVTHPCSTPIITLRRKITQMLID